MLTCCVVIAAFPLFLFCIGVALEYLLDGKIFPAGTIISGLDIILAGLLTWGFGKTLAKKFRLFFLIPISFAFGDLFYGLSNYIIKLPFPNQLGCLTYVIPYLIAMTVILFGLLLLLKKQKSTKSVILLSIAMVLGLIALNSYLIVHPALFHKTPTLSPFLKTLTVLFTIIESAIIGLAAVLLVQATSKFFQLFLFGILFTHVSDIAIRYQSVDLKMLGMSFFENGWCFGLLLMATATIIAKTEIRSITEESIEKYWTGEISKIMPLNSIRGFTIGFILISLTVLWGFLATYNNQISKADQVSAGLLIAVFVFSVAIFGADLLTARLSEITLTLEETGNIHLQASRWGLPKEINVISSQYNDILQQLNKEKEHALSLSSKFAHDVRSPIAALKTAKGFFKALVAKRPDLQEDLEDPTALLEISSEIIQELANGFLLERKRILDLESIEAATARAVQLAKINHSSTPIELEADPVVTPVQVVGLTRVVTNLINNAVEASSGQKPVRVRLKKNAGSFTLTVQDSGTGIPDKTLTKLLNGEFATTKTNGNGIGVTSMLAWAKRQGIKVDISSKTTGINTGTTVSLEITA